MRAVALSFAFVGAGLLGLSLRGGYSIRDVGTLNWDVVLMLTPWGFVRNYVFEPESYLRPYYAQAAERARGVGDPVVLGCVILTVAAALFGLRRLRRELPSVSDSA